MRPKKPSRLHVQRKSSGKGSDMFGTDPDFLSRWIAYSGWILTFSGLPESVLTQLSWCLPVGGQKVPSRVWAKTPCPSLFIVSRELSLFGQRAQIVKWNKNDGIIYPLGCLPVCVFLDFENFRYPVWEAEMCHKPMWKREPTEYFMSRTFQGTRRISRVNIQTRQDWNVHPHHYQQRTRLKLLEDSLRQRARMPEANGERLVVKHNKKQGKRKTFGGDWVCVWCWLW